MVGLSSRGVAPPGPASPSAPPANSGGARVRLHDVRLAPGFRLSPAGVIHYIRENKQKTISLQDVVAYSVSEERACLTLHSYPPAPTGCCGGPTRRKDRRDERLNFIDLEAQREWKARIEAALYPGGRRVRRLLIFVNPAAGSGTAERLYNRHVAPIFQLADVRTTVVLTTSLGHAAERVQRETLTQYDGIVVVSGDGLMTEVINSLMRRPDAAAAIKIPIGIIPAGSGNGMATSIARAGNEPCDPVTAALQILKGHVHPLDVAVIAQGGRRVYSVLSMSWGLVSDIDIESEVFRWMGGARFTVQAMLRVLSPRVYSGKVYYLPAESHTPRSLRGSTAARDFTGSTLTDPLVSAGGEPGTPPGPSTGGSPAWQVIEGEIMLVWLMNVKWMAETMLAGPGAELSDGCLELCVLRACGRSQLLQVLLEMESGAHVRNPAVDYIKVQGLRLVPGPSRGAPGGGFIVVDGEVVARAASTSRGGNASSGSAGAGQPPDSGILNNMGEQELAYGPPVDVTMRPGLASLFCSAGLTGAHLFHPAGEHTHVGGPAHHRGGLAAGAGLHDITLHLGHSNTTIPRQSSEADSADAATGARSDSEPSGSTEIQASAAPSDGYWHTSSDAYDSAARRIQATVRNYQSSSRRQAEAHRKKEKAALAAAVRAKAGLPVSHAGANSVGAMASSHRDGGPGGHAHLQAHTPH